ncbi:Serine/threonine protein kinase [Handroanthus impetiginosus]|uniref:RING-type E3 ubiquitin transferase n=1 Tax=Handroanthus impetiginosus TaxID=429701 RepID=A0A2G9HXQ3_9LAMI|nr:Serine/threonine protein kinase [Handroanthus impetiginosus]
MSNYEPNSSSEEGRIISTAVAIDKDKNSQFAVKWVVDKLKLKENRIILVHVRSQNSFESHDAPKNGREPTPAETQQLFLPYRGFCARKGIRVKEVILQHHDVANTLSEYIRLNSITTIVLGASSRGALARAFKNTDVPSSVAKHAPDFSTVYAVSKAKVLKLKSSSGPDTPSSATSSMPQSTFSPDRTQPARYHPQESWRSATSELSSLDGGKSSSSLSSMDNSREYQHITPRERPFGSKNTSPVNSIDREYQQIIQGERLFGIKIPSSQDSMNEFPQGGKRKGSSPLESSYTSYESVSYGSNYSSPLDSRAGDSQFGHMTPQNMQPSSNISVILQSMDNLNLQVRTKESPPFSMSGSSDRSEMMSFPSDVSFEIVEQPGISDSSRSSSSSQSAEIEEELRRLKQELKQITLKYNIACQEAVTAKDKVRGIVQSKSEGSNLEDAKHAQEAAMAIIEREKLKCRAAVEVANKAQRIAELESEKRKRAEMKFKLEAEEKQKAIDALSHCEIRYRRYTTEEIEVATNYFAGSEKIGEGGYGPVFKALLDHTPVAIKVLRPDMSQGEKQFHREVEVLSHMRHPHMVILLGACPEYGCLVYEYMENGSLEDRLFRKDGTPPLSWRTRFRVAAEIATALNFLHRTRPEPLVHRDLKPANILLDKNYGSKISDVGLSRLVPPSIADNITQYHMTAAAGTFCYIDPEYQQTGMLGTKSDIYSLGVMLLQIITAKPAMGLTHHVESAIETGRFVEVLDPTVRDWPVEEALSFAKLALKCCELRRRDRPDLDSVILPELERLRDLGSQVKPEGRYYYMHPQSQSSGSLSSQASQNRFDYMNPQGQSFQASSSSSQDTKDSSLERQMENQRKNAFASGSSTITTLGILD